MKLIEFNWQPSDRQLRQFAVICLVALPALGWLWGGTTNLVVTLAMIGLALAAVGMVMPAVLKPLFFGLSLIATPIGMVIGELAMLLIYFGVFLPFGLVFRIVRRDSLQLKIDKQRESYWESKKQPTSVASYYRQS